MKPSVRSIPLYITIILLTSATMSAQKTISVPADIPTIQGAINMAQDGDTLMVSPGTYFENIDFVGKAITVRSTDGPAVTILDGSAAAPVVKFENNEGSHSVLDGFTIRNGYEPYGFGLGIKISWASPIIQNNVVTENFGCNASAIDSYFGAPTIQHNTITNNGQLGTGCSGGTGAGISLGGHTDSGQYAKVIGNTITNNVQFWGTGGGISLNSAGNVLVRNNVVRGNSAYDVGGIYVINSDRETLSGNLIVENSGINLYVSVPYQATGLSVVNNTVVTHAGNAASALYVDGFFATTLFANNLVFGQTTTAPFYCDSTSSSEPPQMNNNDAFSPVAIVSYDGVCSSHNGSKGNLSFDPLFVAPASGDYRLQIRSEAIDSGNNTVPGLPTTDVAGNPRIVAGGDHGKATVDLGAYEFVPNP